MSILDIVFPRRCLRCGRIGKYICVVCRRTIRAIPENESICPVCEGLAIDGITHPRCKTRFALDGLTSFFRYDGIIRKGVTSLKYRFVSDLGAEFVSLVSPSLVRAVLGHVKSDSMLVPIPLHPARFRERGFNQAEVLGRFVSERLHIPMKTGVIYRVKKTPAQVEMKTREDRMRNMSDVFAVADTFPIRGARVVLFDDVFTTGATMRSAANTLKRHGAIYVWAVTMAR